MKFNNKLLVRKVHGKYEKLQSLYEEDLEMNSEDANSAASIPVPPCVGHLSGNHNIGNVEKMKILLQLKSTILSNKHSFKILG